MADEKAYLVARDAQAAPHDPEKGPTSTFEQPASSESPSWAQSSAPLRQGTNRFIYSTQKTLYALLALFTFLLWYTPSDTTPLDDPIEAILKDTPLIDTHIDFPIFLRFMYENHIYNFTEDDTLPGQVDFPRLREGKLGASFWSVWSPCPEDNGNYSDSIYTETVDIAYSQIDLVHRLIGRFPEQLSLTTSSSAIFHNHQFPPPYQTIGSVIGGEGLHSIGNKVSNLRLMYQLGMRYMTLTHNCHNIYADAAISPHKPVHGGLSDIGKELVLEFNRMGMMVDLSHVSADTMRDALKVSEAPVIFSHSGAYGMNAHPRNVPDDVLDLVKKNNGVVQATFLPEFVSNATKPTMLDVADHIEYIGKRIGYEHVGIGSDFDGMPESVAGLEDVSTYPALLKELWKRGLSYKELSGVVGGNLLRVMADVEMVAVRSTRLPMEDDVHFKIPVETP